MSVLQALVLGIAQGITEFFPISSSGHLIVIPRFFGWDIQPLVFDTTLHFGTALALIVVFWKDLVKVCGVVSYGGVPKRTLIGTFGFYNIFLGTFPAVIIGFLFNDWFEESFRGVGWVVLFLILGSILMAVAEWRCTRAKNCARTEEISPLKALIIGLFQALAFFSGVSRAGSTISGGMFVGLDRKNAAKFAFLLGIPISLLAGMYEGIFSVGTINELSLWTPMLVGFIASFVTGVLCIEVLLRFLEKKGLWVFVVYRLVFAGLLLVLI